MTSRRNKPPPSEAAPRHLAEEGIAGIEQVQAIVDRAQEMLATGEELTVHFPAALAHDADEFMRRLSLEVGRELAHRAHVGVVVDGMSHDAFFLSPNFQAMLERFDSAGDRPAVMCLFARYHTNYA